MEWMLPFSNILKKKKKTLVAFIEIKPGGLC